MEPSFPLGKGDRFSSILRKSYVAESRNVDTTLEEVIGQTSGSEQQTDETLLSDDSKTVSTTTSASQATSIDEDQQPSPIKRSRESDVEDLPDRRAIGWGIHELSVTHIKQVFTRFRDGTGSICLTGEYSTITSELVASFVPTTILDHDFDGGRIDPALNMASPEDQNRFGGIPPRYKIKHAEFSDDGYLLLYSVSAGKVYRLEQHIPNDLRFEPPTLEDLLPGAEDEAYAVLQHWRSQMPPSAYCGVLRLLGFLPNPEMVLNSMIRNFGNDWLHAFYHFIDQMPNFSSDVRRAIDMLRAVPTISYLLRVNELKVLNYTNGQADLQRAISYQRDEEIKRIQGSNRTVTPPSSPVSKLSSEASKLSIEDKKEEKIVPKPKQPVIKVKKKLTFDKAASSSKIPAKIFMDKTLPGLEQKKPVAVPVPVKEPEYDSEEEEKSMRGFNDFLKSGARPIANHREARFLTPIEQSYLNNLILLVKELKLGYSYDVITTAPLRTVDVATNGLNFPLIRTYYNNLISKKTGSLSGVFRTPGSEHKASWAVANLLYTAEKSPDPGDQRAADFALRHCLNTTYDHVETKNSLEIKYTIPTFNRFNVLTEEELSLDSGELSDDLRSVYKHPKIRQTGYTTSYKAGRERNSHVAGTIDRLNDLKKQRINKDLRSQNEIDSPRKQNKIANVLAAIKRIQDKLDELLKEGDLSIAKYVLTTAQVGSHTLSKLAAHCPWLTGPLQARRKGGIFWMAYAKNVRLPKFIALAGLLFDKYSRGRTPDSEGGWLRDLTGDGDVEANPGPLTLTSMDEVKESIDLLKLFRAPVDTGFPIQHWAHHRLTAYAGTYDVHHGEIVNQIVSHYRLQYPNSVIHKDVSLPLRETHIYPRTIAMAAADGGAPLQAIQHIRAYILPLGAEGFRFPGIRQHFVPHDDEEDLPLYADENDVALDPQPLLDDGHVDRHRVRPAFDDVTLEVYLDLGRNTIPWVDDPAHPEVFNCLWDYFDDVLAVEVVPGRCINLQLPGLRPWGDPVYRLESGSPIFFIAADRYPDDNVPNLERSLYAGAVYQGIAGNTTVLSHRPEPLLKGYRKADVDTYVLNFFGVDVDLAATTSFGGDHRMQLDMTAFNAKLGHYGGWWSLSHRGTFRGVSLGGQPQVLTPWLTVDPQEVFVKTINQSPNPLENCGGWQAPGIPFTNIRQDGRVTGTIYFHMSFATVPSDKAVLWIPSAWHSPEYMPTIALVIMCLAPYPLGNMGLWMRTNDTISEQSSLSYFNWIPGMTSIPGETEFHVIWPRRSPAMIRIQDRCEDFQGMASFRPYAGPTAAGDTAAGFEYQVSGDYDVDRQKAPPANLVEFCLSWINHMTEKEFRNISEKLAIGGVFANSWQVVFDSLAVWSTRTSTLTVTADAPLGRPDAASRANLLANQEEHLRTIHLYGNTIPRLAANENWLTHRPREYDAHISPTLTEAVGAVLGGFAVGKGNRADHKSMLWGFYSSTWLPMATVAFRAIAVAFDAMLIAYKVTPELFQHRYDEGCLFRQVSMFYDELFPSTKVKDPRYLDAVDCVLAATMMGAHLRLCDNQRNLLRTVTMPRCLEGTVYSVDYGTLYSGLVPIKYPDIYYAACSDKVITDWAPFVTTNAGKASYGITSNTGVLREMAHFNFAGPSINPHYCPQQPTVADILLFDGPSHWNSRLLLAAGHAELYQYSSGIRDEDFPALGTLVTMRPWGIDLALMNNEEVSSWAWSNTNYFPLYRWNCREPLILAVADMAFIRPTRAVQTGSESLPFYCWLLTNYFPVPLRSDANERASGGTTEFMGFFKRPEKSAKEATSALLDATSMLVADSSTSGNAQGETVMGVQSGTVSSNV